MGYQRKIFAYYKRLREHLFFLEKKITRSLQKIQGKKVIYAHWFAGRPNFGDLLTPLLLSCFGFTPINTSFNRSDILVVGSLLSSASQNYSGFILGSGLMFAERKNFQNAKLLALRGALTRDLINAPEETILGDPALLISKYFKSDDTKKYVLGIVPHYVDKNDERLQKIRNRYPKDVKIIDVEEEPQQVIDNIQRCEHILSSSLHGLIVADSFQIPSGWLLLSDKVYGKGFKFYDYASAFNNEMNPLTINGHENLSELIQYTSQMSDEIFIVQDSLESAFKSLVSEYS
mgnify:CR=1 FL=1